MELAGALAELDHHTRPREFRYIDTRKSRILLVEAAPHFLPVFRAELSAYAKIPLERLGFEVLLGQPVTEYASNVIRIGNVATACRTIICAAGVQASTAAKWLGVEADRAGRVMVRPDLTLLRDERILVIGGTAAV